MVTTAAAADTAIDSNRDTKNSKRAQAGDTHRVWCSVLSILREQVPEPSFRTWLEGTRLHSLHGITAPETASGTGITDVVRSDAALSSGMAGLAGLATVAVPSTFAAEWLQRRYSGLIADALERCLGRRVGIEFKVDAVGSHRAIHALDGIGPRDDERQLPHAVGESRPLSQPSSLQSSASHSSSSYFPTFHTSSATDATGQHAAGAMKAAVRATVGPVEQSPPSHPQPTPTLNPRNTFDRFLLGRGNQLAASVARRVAEAPGAAYNPLFLYGLRGVGKTHLLQAIGHDAHTRLGARVLFTSALQFHDKGTCSRLASLVSFGSDDTHGGVTGYDLLLVDDLHLIAGGSGRAAQRHLEALVEGMLAAGKGVVVTATHPPDAMLALHETLRFRLRGGMLVAIEPPDAPLRTRMVQRLAGESGVLIAAGAIEILASAGQSMADVHAAWERACAPCVQTASGGAVRDTRDTKDAGKVGEMRGIGDVRDVRDVRESDGRFSGATTAMGAVKPATPTLPLKAITMQDVQRALSERQSRPRTRPETIIDQVSAYFDLEVNELSNASRERRLMLPRHIAMYLIREETAETYGWIARRFARQDHTTAMYACAKVEELIQTDLEVRQMVLELRQMVYGEQQRPAGDLAC